MGIRLWWLALAGLLLQAVVIYRFVDVDSGTARAGVLLGYGAIVPVFAANLRWWGIRLLAVGAALNLIVIVANGGAMPVTLETLQRAGLLERVQADGTLARSKDVVLPAEEIRLYGLSDRFVTTFPRANVFSLGDVFLGAGLLVFAGEYTLRSTRRRTDRAEARTRGAGRRPPEAPTLAPSSEVASR